MLVGTIGLVIWAWLIFAILEWDNPGTLGVFLATTTPTWIKYPSTSIYLG
ncbi:hypothetical protein KCG44_02825 [Pacificimonas sp. WHA3]|uniref:Uncharacterized protein n=1 Tax=Pacificimonas pallii TaxID=2827236 RepID=A0ABS6SBI5_9SPHN|nr:hypothetical protein [Pacificimonas pallii]MBV7255715.1 hypothetical protein [Pacificimonas pallii]